MRKEVEEGGDLQTSLLMINGWIRDGMKESSSPIWLRSWPAGFVVAKCVWTICLCVSRRED